jgi:sugar lactone lactonase YvrE
MALRRFRAAPASERRYSLGEGPFWDAPRNRALWVDIRAGTVHSGMLDGDSVTDATVVEFPETVGAAVSSDDGELLVAGKRRLYHISGEGVVRDGPQIVPEETASRLNDGACDPAGRFLVGSLALDKRVDQEVLVRVEADGRTTVIDDDVGLSNGLAFTPDSTQLYSIDSKRGTVWIRDYDVESGAVGSRREFLQVTGGDPDGMCLDSEGNLWIAVWGAGQVRCYSPVGEQVAVVDIDAPHTTSVAFVGADLDTLLITTSSKPSGESPPREYPDAGRLFLAHVGVSGLAVPLWAGTNPQGARP